MDLAGWGGPVEQGCAAVAFEALELLDERGDVDAEGERRLGEGWVGHRCSEPVQAHPASWVCDGAVQIARGAVR